MNEMIEPDRNKSTERDLIRPKNEMLGLSTVAADAVVTLAELEACCRDYPMAQSLGQVPPQAIGRMVAGIDWGGGASRTVLTLGYMRTDDCFQVLRWERFGSTEDPQRILQAAAELCTRLQANLIAADGGGSGRVLNRLLVERLRIRDMFAILYSFVDQEPHQSGGLTKWTVSRSASIGMLFSRVRTQMILFPRKSDCGAFLDDFACVTAEHDSTMWTVQYGHPESQLDDAMHSTNYALLLATRANSYGQ